MIVCDSNLLGDSQATTYTYTLPLMDRFQLPLVQSKLNSKIFKRFNNQLSTDRCWSGGENRQINNSIITHHMNYIDFFRATSMKGDQDVAVKVTPKDGREDLFMEAMMMKKLNGLYLLVLRL